VNALHWAAALACANSGRQNCGFHGIWETNTFWLASFCGTDRTLWAFVWSDGVRRSNNGAAGGCTHNKSHFALIIIPCHKSATDRRSRNAAAVN
jgi:hypothetical protein